MSGDRERTREGGENIVRNQRGFTLIELLVVAAALSMLALLLLPDLAALEKDFKVTMAVHDIQMLKSALLRFHADMGVWPAKNFDAPALGLADVALMGSNCGASGFQENPNTNNPGLLCQGSTDGKVAIGPSSTVGTFVTINATSGILRLWRGPYVNKKVEANPWGGSYVLSYEDLPNVPGERFAGMPCCAQDVVLKLTNIPGDVQLRIDAKLDDGNLNTGVIRGNGEDTLKVIVAQF